MVPCGAAGNWCINVIRTHVNVQKLKRLQHMVILMRSKAFKHGGVWKQNKLQLTY